MRSEHRSTQAATSRPSRRTVVQGAAWATPAIALGSAVPAMAASPTPGECLVFSLAGDSCKWPGSGSNWSYHLVLCVAKSPSCADTGDAELTITRLTNNANKPLTPCGDTPFPWTVTVPATGQICRDLGAFRSESSASTIVIYGRAGGTQTVPLGEASAPPNIGECSDTSPCAS